VVLREVLHPIEFEFGNVDLGDMGKTESPEKNLSEQCKEPTTNLTHIWARFWNRNPGHIDAMELVLPINDCHKSYNY